MSIRAGPGQRFSRTAFQPRGRRLGTRSATREPHLTRDEPGPLAGRRQCATDGCRRWSPCPDHEGGAPTYADRRKPARYSRSPLRGRTLCPTSGCRRWAPCPDHPPAPPECEIPGCTRPQDPAHEPFCSKTGTHCVTLLTGDPCRIHHPELFRPAPIAGIDPSSPARNFNGAPGRTAPEPTRPGRRPPTSVTCVSCGGAFDTRQPRRAKYCSKRCNYRAAVAARARRREAASA